MKNDRLFGILYLLLADDNWTAGKLATYFEVSPRTIYRDIETLSKMNVPVYMSKGKHGGIRLLEHYTFDKTLLSAEEQKQILFSLKESNALQLSQDDIYEKMKTLFACKEENWFTVDFGVWGKNDDHKHDFHLLKQAIILKKVIVFVYFSARGEQTKRKIEPLQLCFKHNAWYVYGYDLDKQAFRYFKILRMKEITVINDTFSREWTGAVEEQNISPVQVFFTLRIDACLAYRVYDEFAKEQYVKLDNGDFIVHVVFPFDEWVYQYILSFGEHAQVLYPEEVKQKIIAILQKSLSHYM